MNVIRFAIVLVLATALVGCDSKDTMLDNPVTPEPPAVEPPAVDPPATDPPAIDPPAIDPPAVDPPAVDPPAVDPPAIDPPAIDPPAIDPPAIDPPAIDPPAIDPPAIDPPAIDPPAIDPPAIDPPAIDPPADDPPATAEKALKFEDAQRLEVRHSMIGYRNTLLFYTFKDQQAVLRLMIDNKDETFPVKGTMYLFAADTSADGLKKWLNNQHSDGLYPEVPQPVATEALPEDACKVTSFEQTGTSDNGPTNETFKDYNVEVSVADVAVEGKFTLGKFTDKSQVHVKGE